MNVMSAGSGARPQYGFSRHGESDRYLRIGEVAKEFNVTLRALRFYEDKGLISPFREGSTRLYSPRDVARIRLVLTGRKIGFSLREVKHMLDLYDSRGSNTRQLRVVLDKSERQLSRLEEQRREIEEAISEVRTLMRDTRRRLDDRAA